MERRIYILEKRRLGTDFFNIVKRNSSLDVKKIEKKKTVMSGKSIVLNAMCVI